MPPFCLCLTARHALCMLIIRKILHSKNAQFKTEELPKSPKGWKIFKAPTLEGSLNVPVILNVENKNIK